MVMELQGYSNVCLDLSGIEFQKVCEKYEVMYNPARRAFIMTKPNGKVFVIN